MALAAHDPMWAGDNDDVRIVASAGAVGTDALDLLYRRYAIEVRRFCRSRLDADADADDACHETMLRAYRALPRFQRGAPLWPWLATIAANVCSDVHRDHRCESLDGGTLRHEESSADPHAEVVGRMRRALVDDALDALAPQYRSAIYLRDLEGWSYAEIADLHGSSVATVRGNLHRGRLALRKQVQELAETRRMWPLSAVLPSLPGLRRALRGASVDRQVDARSASDLITALGAAAPNVAGAVAAMVAVAGAVALPYLAHLVPDEATPVATQRSAAVLVEPLLPAVAGGGAHDSDRPIASPPDQPSPPAPEPVALSAPVAPVEPAGVSARIDGEQGMVTVSVSAPVKDESPEDESPDPEANASVNLRCDMSLAQRGACDQLVPFPGGT